MTPLLLVDALELATARAEGGIALSHRHKTVTYGELEAYANALAFALVRRGVVPGSRVVTLLEGAEAVIAFWGIAKAGAVGVPLDRDDVDELAALLREVDARALIVDAGVAPTFHHAVARAPQLGVVIVCGREADVDVAGSASYVTYETALAEEDPLSRPTSLQRIDLDDAWLVPDDEGAACILSHRVLLSRAESLVRGLGLEPLDAVSGSAFAEVVIACALSGAAFRVSGEQPREGGRSLWICDADEPPPTGSTAVMLYASATHGPVAVMQGNEPARVLPNVDVRVIAEDGMPAAPKVVGEIAVRSSSIAASATLLEGYVKTGDAGMLDDAGGLYIL